MKSIRTGPSRREEQRETRRLGRPSHGSGLQNRFSGTISARHAKTISTWRRNSGKFGSSGFASVATVQLFGPRVHSLHSTYRRLLCSKWSSYGDCAYHVASGRSLFSWENVMFRKLLRVNSGDRAFAVGFIHRPTSEIVLDVMRLIFVGVTAALFLAWLTSANRGGVGRSADADCVSSGRSGARCTSHPYGVFVPISRNMVHGA